jgi:excisionase family DNA binding protein
LADEGYISLSQAAALCGLTRQHLSLLARRGKLRAVKIGRDWLTTTAAVEEYMGDAAKRANDPLKNRR